MRGEDTRSRPGAMIPRAPRWVSSRESHVDLPSLSRSGGPMPRHRPPCPRELREQIVASVRSGRTPLELAAEFEPPARCVRGSVAEADREEGRRDVGLRGTSPALRLGAGVWLGEDLPAVDRRAVVHPLTHLEPVVPRSLGSGRAASGGGQPAADLKATAGTGVQIERYEDTSGALVAQRSRTWWMREASFGWLTSGQLIIGMESVVTGIATKDDTPATSSRMGHRDTG